MRRNQASFFGETASRAKTCTLADIAAECNVSKATVSRVLNTPHMVREKTRLPVQEALRKNGFVLVDALDHNTEKNNNKLIGLIVSGLTDTSFKDTVQSLQAMAGDHDLLIGDTNHSPYVETQLLKRMVERHVACVVMLGHCINAEIAVRETQNNGTPCLLLWSRPAAEDLNYIAFDSTQAVSQAADYLISLGHNRIGLIVGPYDRVSGARDRVEGLRRSLEKHAIAMNGNYTVMVDKGFTPEAGRLAMTRLLEISPRPTAVILAADILAIGAYAAVKQAGLRIPEDISLITLDDIDVAPHMDPPLTTVHIPAHEMGRMAGQYLAKLLNGEGKTCRICLPTSLMLRGSAAEAPRE